jgi:SWIM zinc finger
MKNYLLSLRCAGCLKMPKRLVNREEQGRLIAETSGAISMITESNYNARSTSGFNTYNVVAIKSGWVCSCPDYARYNAKCKHIYAVEFYRRQSATS